MYFSMTYDITVYIMLSLQTRVLFYQSQLTLYLQQFLTIYIVVAPKIFVMYIPYDYGYD